MLKRIVLNKTFCLLIVSILPLSTLFAQGVKYMKDFSPAEGLIKPQEKPYREEICLNGSWDFQPVEVPRTWKDGSGIPPELTMPEQDKWEKVKIKIPSAWNVNEWGGGRMVGKDTDRPYAPSSLYYPSYPSKWGSVRMGWLRKSFTVPADWTKKRVFAHFEAVAGECVIMVNGKEIERHFDTFLPFDADVTDALQKGKNEILVGVRHANLFNKFHPQYKYFKTTHPLGSNADILAGIWQDVFLQALPEVKVNSIFAKPFIEKDLLEFEVEVANKSINKQQLSLRGNVKAWINRAKDNGLASAEIDWTLGSSILEVSSPVFVLKPGETRKITLSTKVGNKLKFWSPDAPNLYTISLNLSESGKTVDIKTERFGWRSLAIKGKDFILNGNKIQCFGDLQHPFGPWITSRRFAWAWYKMIKDVGGNAVRPHAQPWPRVYYDLADEIGLMVLDETALFGSSINLNFEEEDTWKNSAIHLDNLILRDRNHPSVIGWSAGNELFAISLLNKPSPEVAKKWDLRIIELTKRAGIMDPTRTFVTVDGDKDMDGTLPVYSKHYGHGLRLKELPQVDKPIIVGESGATYYGKPRELFQFVGQKAYGSYYDRSEALAIDAYQNAVQMARPHLAWFSPSELCWFGIEHLNLGYHNNSRLPDVNDGIFPGLPYQEGKPGAQYERIPPYVTTFNPGLDPKLPLYKPLPMFDALKAAMAKGGPKSSKWDHFQDTTNSKPKLPATTYANAYLVGEKNSRINSLLDSIGVLTTNDYKNASFIVIDANADESQVKAALPAIDAVKQSGGLIWILLKDKQPDAVLSTLIPGALMLENTPTTALKNNLKNQLGAYFDLRSLYFSEMGGDRNIMKKSITGTVLSKSSVVLEAAPTDWSLFNGVAENSKCAQVVLYEFIKKPIGVGMLDYQIDRSRVLLSSLDYTLVNKETIAFWRKICLSLGIAYHPVINGKPAVKKNHDLLLDGPVSN